jgi:hypothetical protein
MHPPVEKAMQFLTGFCALREEFASSDLTVPQPCSRDVRILTSSARVNAAEMCLVERVAHPHFANHARATTRGSWTIQNHHDAPPAAGAMSNWRFFDGW